MDTRAQPGDAPRWLSEQQLTAWMAFTLMLAQLPTALEGQLQCDAKLSYVEYYVLASLSDAPDWAVRMSTLSVLTNAELSRLSHLITRLERRGFVRRQGDPRDGRYTLAVLTDAGHDHLVAAAPGHVAKVRDLVIDVLTDEELASLSAISQKITARIAQAK